MNMLRQFVFIFILAVFSLFACTEDEVSHSASCQDRLDASSFTSVANDSSCSAYERGAAELGLAGISIKNFLADGAVTNITQTFSIAANSFENNITHFENAQNYTKSSADVLSTEVHLVATMGVVLNEVYGRVDSNFDGSVTLSEVSSFMKINTSVVTNSGGSQLLTSGGYHLVDSAGLVCLWDGVSATCTEDVDANGILDSGETTTHLLTSLSTLTTVAMITQVESLQQLFLSDNTSDLKIAFSFLDTLTQSATSADGDLGNLGVSENSVLRKFIAASLDRVDNGATCQSTINDIIDGLTVILQNAITGSTVASDYKIKNLISAQEVAALSTGTALALPSSLSTGDLSIQAKLIYKSGAGYTALYENADANIKNTLTVLSYLVMDSSGKLKPSVKGDGVVNMKEIFCF